MMAAAISEWMLRFVISCVLYVRVAATSRRLGSKFDLGGLIFSAVEIHLETSLFSIPFPFDGIIANM